MMKRNVRKEMLCVFVTNLNHTLRPEVSKMVKGLKLLVTVTVNLRIEVEVSKMKSILKLILSLIS